MKVKRLFGMVICLAVLASCGGGSGGGGGGLPTARAGIIYKIINEAMSAGLLPALQAMLELMNTNCPFGTAAAVDLTGLTGTCVDKDVVTSGTWTLSGTLTCKHEPSGTGILFTITAMDAALTLADCVSTASVDTNGDGTNETVNAILTGPIDPFEFGANSTILADFSGADPVVTLNGSADLTFTNFSLGGDVTATASYLQGLNFDNMVITADEKPTCDMNIVTATETGETGTCTIQTSCDTCS